MRADPVRKRRGPGGLGQGVAQRAEHADEQFRLPHLTGLAIDDRHPLAGIIHKGLVAGCVLLAHRRRQTLARSRETVRRSGYSRNRRDGRCGIPPKGSEA